MSTVSDLSAVHCVCCVCLILFMCLCMYSFLCLVFSFPCPMCAPCPSCALCALCALCTVSTCPGVLIALCFPCLVCLLCVCNVFRCSGYCCVCSHRVQCVGVVISWEGVVCVLHVVMWCSGCCFVIVRACVQRVKSGVFTPQEYIYKKSAFFLKNNCCFSCVYGKKAVPL